MRACALYMIFPGRSLDSEYVVNDTVRQEGETYLLSSGPPSLVSQGAERAAVCGRLFPYAARRSPHAYYLLQLRGFQGADCYQAWSTVLA